MINLMNEPEIKEENRDLPQILTEDTIAENVHIAVGFASRCWKDADPSILHGEQVFWTEQAIRVSDELCAYVRIQIERAVELARWNREG